MTDVLMTAWIKGLERLKDQGVQLPPPGHRAIENARAEFETIAGPIQGQPKFDREAPKLAAHLVTESLARHYYELASRDWL
ncbi:MAG: hypothetical protein ABIK86_07350 [candidate division WOR-3 bacterium]